eukprot:3426132-Pyramimonas_sp.AAC.1
MSAQGQGQGRGRTTGARACTCARADPHLAAWRARARADSHLAARAAACGSTFRRGRSCGCPC